MDRLKSKIMRLIATNEWLNGAADFMDGDLCPELYFEDPEPLVFDDIRSLYEAWRKWDNGIFLFGKILLIKHWNYGTFVYDIEKARNGLDYFEHLDPDVSFESFRKLLSR